MFLHINNCKNSLQIENGILVEGPEEPPTLISYSEISQKRRTCIGGAMGTIKTQWSYSHGRRFNVSCTHLKSDSAESYKI